MITKDLVKWGIKSKCIQFITDPYVGTGVVCKIGYKWFYFGGFTTEELTPDEYISYVSEDDLVDEVFAALEDLRTSGEASAFEYKYYESFINLWSTTH